MKNLIPFSVLATLCLSLNAVAENAPVNRFSLKSILDQVGYGPRTTPGVPIESAEDMRAAMEGHPNRVIRSRRFEWPFSKFAGNPSLSAMAFSLNTQAFGKDAERNLVIVDVPNSSEQNPRILQELQLDVPVSELLFINDNLLRVETIQSSKYQQGYARRYSFISVGSETRHFLNEALPFDHVLNCRAFTDSIYLVQYDPTGRGIEASSKYAIVRYDAVTRIPKILHTLADSKIGARLSHDPVDSPGRDVWRLGKSLLKVKFSTSDQAGEWVKMEMTVEGDQVTIGREVDVQADLSPIVGTPRYVQRSNDQSVMVLDRETGATVIHDRSVSPYQYLEYVTGGFIGEVANHPDYQHYFFKFSGETKLLLADRLVQAEHRDGGFLGVSDIDRSSGEVSLFRVIYNAEALAQATQEDDCAAALMSDLLGKHRALNPKKKK